MQQSKLFGYDLKKGENKMDSEFVAYLNKCHDEDKHHEIIQAITEMAEEKLDYELVGILARAYNNIGEYEKAIALLMSVKEQGEGDSLWLFRLGYAYFYSYAYDKALTLFEKCKEINPSEEDADWFIERSKEAQEVGELANRDDNSYTAVIKHETSISMCFYIEQDKPFAVGEKMNEINEEAYMNGYNWEAFFDYYLSKYATDITVGMNTDPEAGMYVAYYELTPENEARAEKFADLIYQLIENEEALYKILKSEGENIAWD